MITDAIKGYIIYAADVMNAESRAEYGSNTITDTNLQDLLKKVDQTAEDLTEDEAATHYRKSRFT